MENQFWIQISAGTGPEECCLAVKKLVEKLLRLDQYTIELIKISKTKQNNYSAAWLRIQGDETAFKNRWEGSVQFIFKSPYRKHHQRKNWFVAIKLFAAPKQWSWTEKEVQIKTARSSGAGGQHVNKVETAVSITHLPSKITVHASEERSQLLNKKLAFARLDKAIKKQNQQAQKKVQEQKWLQHKQLQRGNPKQVFKN